MKKLVILLGTGLILLIIETGTFLVLNKEKKVEEQDKKEVVETILPTPTLSEEDKKRIEEEEKRKKEEERKRFIATYGPCRFVPILMYHHVGPVQNSLYVSPETFTAQMDYLLGKGYTTVSLEEVINSLQGGVPLPAKPIVITLDDGYKDNYENAYPILRTRGMKATIFMVTQLANGGDYLSWEQAREMQGSGLITIGNHTMSHKSLPNVDLAGTRDEILSANDIIAANIGTRPRVFAYPYGGIGQAETILKEGAFSAAVTTKQGLSCAKLPFDLPRIRIGNTPLGVYGL